MPVIHFQRFNPINELPKHTSYLQEEKNVMWGLSKRTPWPMCEQEFTPHKPLLISPQIVSMETVKSLNGQFKQK